VSATVYRLYMIAALTFACVCVCVCVCEREREREGINSWPDSKGLV